MRKAVFLDRDGVINHTLFKMGKQRAPYSLEEFSFIDGVREAIQLFKAHDYLTIVVTNQPDVARGWVTREQVDLVNNFVIQELGVSDLLSCFHTEKDNCHCRKPRPGMLLEAASKWGISLKDSFMVGDRLSDVEAGQRAGCKSILVGLGDTTESVTASPEFQCRSLLEASSWILPTSWPA